MGLYKLLAGKHVQNDAEGNNRLFKKGDIFESNQDEILERLNGGGGKKFQRLDIVNPEEPPPEPVPTAGELVKTSIQYDKKLSPTSPSSNPAIVIGQRQMGDKVPPLQPLPIGAQHSNPGAQAATKQLDHMNVKELQDLAAAEEIDLKSAKTKDEIVKAIRAAGHK